MDNSVDLPGYKYYVEPDGTRPDMKVTFVNLVEADDAVNGVVFEGDPDVLDLRERNYSRCEVEPGLWAYIGTPEARARYEEGPSVVSREYLETVRRGFEALGQLARFEQTTDPPRVPVRDLRRVDLG
jgi:hypothetical protein